MIDYLALALGHGLMVVALLRLVLRDGVDVDPLLERIRSDTADHRKSTIVTARNAARRARSGGDPAADEVGNTTAGKHSRAPAAQR